MNLLSFLFGPMRADETPARFAWRCTLTGIMAVALFASAAATLLIIYVIFP